MRQLSALDTQFLTIESPTTAGHVGSLVVVDPSTALGRTWDLCTVRALLESRLHLTPVLRRRLVEVPFGIARPYWADDPAFDLSNHVRELVLSSPGSDAQLSQQVAQLHAQALDRRRPPWELYVITGLADGRAAIYSKVHHAAIDGVSGADLMATMFDIRPEPRDVEPPDGPFAPGPLPSRLGLLSRGVTSRMADQVTLARRLPPALLHLGTATGRLKAPRTPLNRAITAHRRFAFGSVPLTEIKAVREQYGGTVNDIVMALCTSVLRRWLAAHDGLPDVPLVAAVPVSVRQRDRSGTHGNAISVMLSELPTHLADSAARIRATRESVEQAKARFGAVPPTLVRDLSALLPTSGVAARPLYTLAGLVGPAFNLIVSNVPGPRVPLYVAGAKVEGVFPVSAVTSFTGALNITVFSHSQAVDFGFIACRDAVPDAWELVRHLDEAREELLASAA